MQREEHMRRPTGESVGASEHIGRSWRYFTMARLLLFTMRGRQWKNGNDDSLLMLTVTGDAGRINIKERSFIYSSYTKLISIIAIYSNSLYRVMI